MMILTHKSRILLVFLLTLFHSSGLFASGICEELVTKSEQSEQIPTGLLASIANVESGFNPYALNHKGRSHYFNNHEEITTKINQLLAGHQTNFDVGCMQINYHFHHQNFINTEDMINPAKNVEYAARLLKHLYIKTGTWHQAVRLYHSQNPKYHKIYSRKIALLWLKTQ